MRAKSKVIKKPDMVTVGVSRGAEYAALVISRKSGWA
jgi:hypothetical protein